MDPSHSRRYTDHEIECQVVDLLNKAYPIGVTIPVDIDLLVECHPRVDDIIPANLEEQFGIAATLVYKSGSDTFDIFIDENTVRGRASFSIAHEFGHIVLHGDLCKGCTTLADAVELQRRLKRNHTRIEAEADKFASYLLMPRKAMHNDTAIVFAHLVKEHGHDGESIQSKLCPALATRYKVSRRAMAIRLERLGLQKKICTAIEHRFLSLDI